MDTALKRICAYIIDLFLVSFIVSLISTVEFINPYYDQYRKSFEKYQTVLNDYQEEKITVAEFEEKAIPLNYDLTKYNVITNGITIILTIAYFGIYQGLAKGQTLGKRLMKIQIVSNNDKQLNPGNFLLRCIILNSILFRVLNLIGIYVFKAQTFNNYSNIIFYLEGFVEIVIFVMVMLRKDGRGLHDMICNTKVINLNPVVNTKDTPVETVKEEKIIEAKPVKPKTKSNKKKNSKENTKK